MVRLARDVQAEARQSSAFTLRRYARLQRRLMSAASLKLVTAAERPHLIEEIQRLVPRLGRSSSTTTLS